MIRLSTDFFHRLLLPSSRLFQFLNTTLTYVQVRGFALETAGPDPHIGRVLGANFAAGMLAGGIAAAATCPLDVVKTWRQIEVR